MAKITIQGTEITILQIKDADYISLTDMAHSQMEEHVIIKWLSLKSTIEYIGEWEILFNPDFNYTEFGTIKNLAGSNNFVLSVKQWIEKTGAIGITAKAGRYGGTYAHKDIAFHFGMWISPRFQLLLVKEFQRLKEDEQKALGWTAKRELAKINYHIHTDAISLNYDSCDLYDSYDFWSNNTHSYHKNQINHSSDNMENLNAVFIGEDIPQQERLIKLNQIAIQQMSVLQEVENRKLLK
ncbi:MAG: KilA-N domain-containing protein [Dysgonamonadaceae bacterium]|jgi:hypothetical protein|nr:KilA-N domain-containing protein [Dysgonamonadaceae bacterium]